MSSSSVAAIFELTGNWNVCTVFALVVQLGSGRKRRKLHGKEMEIDSTFDLEKKRNTSIKSFAIAQETHV